MKASKLFNAVSGLLVVILLIITVRNQYTIEQLSRSVSELEYSQSQWKMKADQPDNKPVYSPVISKTGSAEISGTEIPAIDDKSRESSNSLNTDTDKYAQADAVLDEIIQTGYVDRQKWEAIDEALANGDKDQARHIWERLFAEIESGNLAMYVD
jgi:hypothetical protein